MANSRVELIRMVSSETVVFKVEDENDDYLFVVDAITLMPSKDGNISLIPWLPFCDDGTTIKVPRRNIVYYATPNEELLNQYNDIFSNIITPQKAGKIIT